MGPKNALSPFTDIPGPKPNANANLGYQYIPMSACHKGNTFNRCRSVVEDVGSQDGEVDRSSVIQETRNLTTDFDYQENRRRGKKLVENVLVT